MIKSDNLDKFAPAFVAAQGEVDHAHKNSQNPHLKNKYANLAEVIDTVTPVFNKHGLGIFQVPGMSGDRVTLTTIVLHTSGQYLGGVAETPVPKQDPQGVGSGTTYLRRYSTAAVAGITQDDDDGEGALNRKPKAKAPTQDEQSRAATGTWTREAARQGSKVIAQDPESPQALYDAILADIARTPYLWRPDEITALQGRIRALHGVDKALGAAAYQAARRAEILE